MLLLLRLRHNAPYVDGVLERRDGWQLRCACVCDRSTHVLGWVQKEEAATVIEEAKNDAQSQVEAAKLEAQAVVFKAAEDNRVLLETARTDAAEKLRVCQEQARQAQAALQDNVVRCVCCCGCVDGTVFLF